MSIANTLFRRNPETGVRLNPQVNGDSNCQLKHTLGDHQCQRTECGSAAKGHHPCYRSISAPTTAKINSYDAVTNRRSFTRSDLL
jgi:hypothetical protein